jgi:hypothetical protein
MARALIVTPTYDERDNLEPLITSVFEILTVLRLRWNALTGMLT